MKQHKLDIKYAFKFNNYAYMNTTRFGGFS